MTGMSVTDIVLILGVLTTSIVTIINAWKGHSDRQMMTHRAAVVAAELTGVVTRRSDSQDHQLNKIEQATNGGVQALRNEVSSLKALLATAVEELRTERAKP